MVTPLTLLLLTSCAAGGPADGSGSSGGTGDPQGGGSTGSNVYEYMGICFESDGRDCNDYGGDRVDVKKCTSGRTTGDFLDCAIGELNELGEDGWHVVSFNNTDSYYGIPDTRVLILERATASRE